MRRHVTDTESDNMADMALSQGGTCISSLVQYDYKTHGYWRRYSSAIGVPRCSNLLRANVLPAGTQDFDVVNAMTNLVVHAMHKLDLPQWSPMRKLCHWRHHAEHTGLRAQMQAHMGLIAKRVILSHKEAPFSKSMTWTPPGV